MNPQVLRRSILSRVCLPFHHSGMSYVYIILHMVLYSKVKLQYLYLCVFYGLILAQQNSTLFCYQFISFPISLMKIRNYFLFLAFAALFILGVDKFGGKLSNQSESENIDQLTPVLLMSLEPGKYEIISTKSVGDKYQWAVKSLESLKVSLVDAGMGPPNPPETPGTQFSVEVEGTVRFDVKTVGIPPETTKVHTKTHDEEILNVLPDGDYEILEVTHEGYAPPDHKSTYYVYKLKDLKTEKVVLVYFIRPTGYLERIGSKFRLTRLSNGGSRSDPL